MKVNFEYFAQVRKAAGVEKEELEVAGGSELSAALEAAADAHGDDFRTLVLGDGGAIRPSIIVLVNGQAARRDQPRELAAGDVVALLSAVAGG